MERALSDDLERIASSRRINIRLIDDQGETHAIQVEPGENVGDCLCQMNAMGDVMLGDEPIDMERYFVSNGIEEGARLTVSLGSIIWVQLLCGEAIAVPASPSDTVVTFQRRVLQRFGTWEADFNGAPRASLFYSAVRVLEEDPGTRIPYTTPRFYKESERLGDMGLQMDVCDRETTRLFLLDHAWVTRCPQTGGMIDLKADAFWTPVKNLNGIDVEIRLSPRMSPLDVKRLYLFVEELLTHDPNPDPNPT